VSAESMRLRVALVPDTSGIGLAHHAVDDLSRRILKDQDLGWRVAMVAHELLDNARRHGVGGTAELFIDIDVTEEGHVANMRVRSRSTPAQLEQFRTTLAEVQGAPDAWSYYLEVAHRTAATSKDRSGLGLARIRAEGEMAITATFEPDDYVSVCAELRRGGAS
jgi:two-component sensor histidine kinase